MSNQLTVEFSCPECLLSRRRVVVRLRRTNEDVVHWMDEVGRMVAIEHRILSPICYSRGCDILIPVMMEAGNGDVTVGLQAPEDIPQEFIDAVWDRVSKDQE